MSASALETESSTDIISYFALTATAIALFVMGDIIGGGGDLMLFPGTDFALNISENILIVLGAGVAVAYVYNGQEISNLEAVDGFFAAIGLALIIGYHYTDAVPNAIPSGAEPFAGFAITILGAGAVYVIGFGDDGGIIG
jgi:hypothetical protein